jgi:hypothetical protein
MTQKSLNLDVPFQLYVEVVPSVSCRALTVEELRPLIAASADMASPTILRVSQTTEQLIPFMVKFNELLANGLFAMIIS